MFEPGLPSALILVGAALFFVGFGAIFTTLMRNGAMGPTAEARARAMRLFLRPAEGRERQVFRGGPAAMLVGAMCCFSGVAWSGARENAPCEAACEATGHDGGWMRGHPHDPEQRRDRRCWCYEGSAVDPTWVEPVAP